MAWQLKAWVPRDRGLMALGISTMLQALNLAQIYNFTWTAYILWCEASGAPPHFFLGGLDFDFFPMGH